MPPYRTITECTTLKITEFSPRPGFGLRSPALRAGVLQHAPLRQITEPTKPDQRRSLRAESVRTSMQTASLVLLSISVSKRITEIPLSQGTVVPLIPFPVTPKLHLCHLSLEGYFLVGVLCKHSYRQVVSRRPV